MCDPKAAPKHIGDRSAHDDLCSPSSLPVDRLMKCTRVQAGHVTVTKVPGSAAGSTANGCWTFIPVLGHRNVERDMDQTLARRLDVRDTGSKFLGCDIWHVFKNRAPAAAALQGFGDEPDAK
ncbi:hypothetical protein [Bradyrhizobium sp.]|uniref:hypothetical protein n=1 Tax=Bradyrhizobium sp. TaxID=376 RepID=UPI003C43AAA1